MTDVLFVTKSLGRGGAEANICDLSVEMRRRGLEVRVLVTGPTDLANLSKLDAANVPVIVLPNTIGIKFLLDISKKIRFFRPRIVHSHMPLANQLCRVISSSFKVPLITTEHNAWERIHPIHRLLSPILCKRDTASLACSHSVSSSFPYPLQINSNGRDFTGVLRDAARGAMLPVGVNPKKDLIFLNVANVNAKKDQHLLVDAFARLGKSINGKRPILLIAGDRGDAWDALSTQIKKAVPDGRIHLLGRRDDVAGLMCTSDALVVTSRFEGLPLSVLEAMRLNLPVISVDVGEIHSLLGASPWFVRSRDPAIIAEKMASICSSPDREAVTYEAKERVILEYSIEEQTNSLLKIYASAIGEESFTNMTRENKNVDWTSSREVR